mgnify:CR=1 FL=1
MTEDPRSCTCHPSEAPVPCRRKYAASLCLADYWHALSHDALFRALIPEYEPEGDPK